VGFLISEVEDGVSEGIKKKAEWLNVEFRPAEAVYDALADGLGRAFLSWGCFRRVQNDGDYKIYLSDISPRVYPQVGTRVVKVPYGRTGIAISQDGSLRNTRNATYSMHKPSSTRVWFWCRAALLSC
jgi:hypothetical protein